MLYYSLQYTVPVPNIIPASCCISYLLHQLPQSNPNLLISVKLSPIHTVTFPFINKYKLARKYMLQLEPCDSPLTGLNLNKRYDSCSTYTTPESTSTYVLCSGLCTGSCGSENRL
ncbi:hypothetical protein NQD34_007391 [Periophthalmus magnuspinnatus]|nr:hypothetical protein NQD34_007391 [Periophthalmus magnuspinnatus]